MKTILLCLMLLAGIESNGQKVIPDSILTISNYKRIISFHPSSTATISAFLKNGSDTLVIYDTVIELYGIKIIYIKLKDGKVIKLN